MPRTIVDIPAAQLAEIDGLCQRLGISRAEGVRRALEAYLAHSHADRADGFGLWSDPGAPPSTDTPARGVRQPRTAIA